MRSISWLRLRLSPSAGTFDANVNKGVGLSYERSAWVGNGLLSVAVVFLAWVPVSPQLTQWASIGIAAVVAVSIAFLFPRKRGDGSTTRLLDRFHTNTATDQRPTMTAGANSNQIVNEGGGTFNIGKGN